MELIEEAVAAFRKGDNEYATRIAHVALQVAQKAQDARREVDALCMLARIALRLGDFGQFAERAAEARVRAQGDARLEGLPLHLEAVAARARGDLAAARDLFRRSLKLSESAGDDQAAAVGYRNLAYIELHVGNRERARRLFLEARRRTQRLRDLKRYPYIIGDAAVLAMEDGDPAKAATLAGAADAAFRAADEIPDPEDASEQDRVCDRARQALGERAFRFSYEVGAKLTMAEALTRM